MIALMLLCVLAGVAIAVVGPRASGQPKAAPCRARKPAPAEPPAAAMPPPRRARRPAAAAPAPVARRRPPERPRRHPGERRRPGPQAAAAAPAAAVAEASQGRGPVRRRAGEPSRAISPPSPELQALARLAEAGAPSRTALAASFPDYAALAASAARAPGDEAGLGDRIVYALSRVVSLRRVGDLTGDGVDAVLARAERQVEDGDLDRALATLDRLPPSARDAMAPWRGRAERRAEIDRQRRRLRARALRAWPPRGGPSGAMIRAGPDPSS